MKTFCALCHFESFTFLEPCEEKKGIAVEFAAKYFVNQIIFFCPSTLRVYKSLNVQRLVGRGRELKDT